MHREVEIVGLLRVLIALCNKELNFLFPSGGMSSILILHTCLVQIEGRVKVLYMSCQGQIIPPPDA